MTRTIFSVCTRCRRSPRIRRDPFPDHRFEPDGFPLHKAKSRIEEFSDGLAHAGLNRIPGTFFCQDDPFFPFDLLGGQEQAARIIGHDLQAVVEGIRIPFGEVDVVYGFIGSGVALVSPPKFIPIFWKYG